MRPRSATSLGRDNRGTTRLDLPSRRHRLEPRTDGKVYCPQCLCPVSLNSTGSLRQHNDDQRRRCWNKAADPTVTGLIELPPVHIPAESQPPRPAGKAPQPQTAQGECRECGRWLPGERTLCGACAVRLNGTR